MAQITRRRAILAALVDRLEDIVAGELAANGVDLYATNAGQNILLGVAPEMGQDDPDIAIVLIVGDEIAVAPGQQLVTSISLPVEIQMLAKADLDLAWLTIEDGIGDIKRAIERADRTLGKLARTVIRGPVRTLPREPGSTAVGAGITYQIELGETWGTP